MKSLVFTTAALFSTLLMAGCATDWQKPDGTDADRYSDQAECRVMANQADDSETFDDCMKGRGWMDD
ncbi:hypothetical protein [Halotalea alkalilenta]|uniref:hypothetical protein n=1 Tax=Halotalea alkalilenta TaxID=376489 RepID=UPI000481C01D|nr:hypothetical protein [Halotalea alkalilenta]